MSDGDQGFHLADSTGMKKKWKIIIIHNFVLFTLLVALSNISKTRLNNS